MLKYRFTSDSRIRLQLMKRVGEGWKLVMQSGMQDEQMRKYFEKAAETVAMTLKSKTRDASKPH
jgi:hypothetical protein